MSTLKDTTTNETRRIQVCYYCDPDIYENGKPILPSDKYAEKEPNGEWVCGDCKLEEIRMTKMRVLGVNHPEVRQFSHSHLWSEPIFLINSLIIFCC